MYILKATEILRLLQSTLAVWVRGSDKCELLVPSVAPEQISALSKISLHFSSIMYKTSPASLVHLSPGGLRDQTNAELLEPLLLPENSHFNLCPRGFFRLVSNSRSVLKIENAINIKSVGTRVPRALLHMDCLNPYPSSY